MENSDGKKNDRNNMVSVVTDITKVDISAMGVCIENSIPIEKWM